jgi:hypothetical protein
VGTAAKANAARAIFKAKDMLVVLPTFRLYVALCLRLDEYASRYKSGPEHRHRAPIGSLPGAFPRDRCLMMVQSIWLMTGCHRRRRLDLGGNALKLLQ